MVESETEEDIEKWQLKYADNIVKIFLVLLSILIIGMSVFSYRRIEKKSCEERESSLTQIMEKVVQNMKQVFEGEWENVQYFINYIEADTPRDEEELFEKMKTFPPGEMHEDALYFIFDEEGNYYDESGKKARWEKPLVLNSNQSRQLIVTNVYGVGKTDEQMVFLARIPKALEIGDKKYTHMCLIRDMVSFDNVLTVQGYEGRSSTYIINQEGTQVYHQKREQEEKIGFNVLKGFDNLEYEHGMSAEQVRKEIKEGKPNSCHVRLKKEDYLLSYYPIPANQWYAILMVPMDMVSRNLNQYLLLIFGSVGSISLLLLVIISIWIGHNARHVQLKQEAANRMLRGAAEAEKKANRAKSEFLSHMSHDIRTPLNGIIGMTEIAKKNTKDVECIKDCLDKITVSSGHLLSLINDVLDMSRIESGKAEIHMEDIDLIKLLEECASLVEGQLVSRKITFVKNFDEITHTELLIDGLHLRRILVNILGNAVKFTPDGGTISFHVSEEECKEEEEKSLFLFAIEDTGMGMKQEYLEHIFEPFSQEDGGSRTTYKGTGLGMAIVKELVELMGGKITVKSELGHGSLFLIAVPAKWGKVQEIEEEETEELAGMRVLLVEDNELNMEIVSDMLEDQGIEVIHASDGKEALELFKNSEPGTFEIILMDVMMPVMDGCEATMAIRSLNRKDAKKIPIIAMTANAYAEDRRKVIAAGMNEHLTKPLVEAKVLHTLAVYRKRINNHL